MENLEKRNSPCEAKLPENHSNLHVAEKWWPKKSPAFLMKKANAETGRRADSATKKLSSHSSVGNSRQGLRGKEGGIVVVVVTSHYSYTNLIRLSEFNDSPVSGMLIEFRQQLKLGDFTRAWSTTLGEFTVPSNTTLKFYTFSLIRAELSDDKNPPIVALMPSTFQLRSLLFF
jgi:hypothetical protein